MFGKKTNKYNLLQKDQSSRVELDEMIELEDFRYANKEGSANTNNPYYAMEEDTPNYHEQIPKEIIHEPYPKYINMNGICFKREDVDPGMQPSTKKVNKFPSMIVKCSRCYENQSIPGNSSSFQCFSCNLLNSCQQRYGLFLCGSCRKKVCYEYGTSDHIRCTRCQTVNKVYLWPIQTPPTKNNNRDYQLYSQDSQIVSLQSEDYPIAPHHPQKQQFQQITEKELNYGYPSLS